MGAGEAPGYARAPEARGPRAVPWAYVLSLFPLGLLVTAAYFARWVRPSGDEWCFLPVIRDHGLSGMVGKFYFDNNGRVVNGVLVWLYGRSGVPGQQWFAPVSAVLVLGILWAVTALALRRAALTVPRGVALCVASMVTVVFLLGSPNTYKTFFWPAASVSHTLAPVLACAAVIPFLLAGSRRGRGIALGIAVVIGLCIGTLSEQTTIVVLVVLIAASALSFRTADRRRRRRLRAWFAVGIASTAAGALILVTSPGSRRRRGGVGAQKDTALIAPDSLAGAARGFGHIMIDTFSSWQYLGAIAAGVLLGLVMRSPGGTRPDAPRRPVLLVCAGAVTFLVAGYLSTLLAYPVFHSGVVESTRLWNDFLFLYVALLTGLGMLLGQSLQGVRPHRGALRWTAAVACAAVCVGLAPSLVDLGGRMRVRAHAWERQDVRLRARVAQGARVLPYAPTPIAKMTEPFGNGKRSWATGCVARYYHLTRVDYTPKVP
ncbi:hypothetical protein EDD93_5088 [Streptomyces sp. 840.1]|uniref:DUF6056 family protein n=1 Tax=Streptomyces sp. 840.1 TaxID=2485152 RepID=UPI000FB64D56|nr:DUF6056 family protein [Streptomyces sp. 840.1]ROQ70564.1 hypothetical protein EDD93_5088 [Streptomyces sp. 840.1]